MKYFLVRRELGLIFKNTDCYSSNRRNDSLRRNSLEIFNPPTKSTKCLRSENGETRDVGRTIPLEVKTVGALKIVVKVAS